MQGNAAAGNRELLLVFSQGQRRLHGTGAAGRGGSSRKGCSVRREAPRLPEPGPGLHPSRRGRAAGFLCHQSRGCASRGENPRSHGKGFFARERGPSRGGPRGRSECAFKK